MRLPARNTDPNTSKEAATHVVASGLAAAQQQQTVNAVRLYPDHTALEIAEFLNIDRYMLGRRLSECEESGKVVRGEERKCTISNRKAHTWSIPE